ncbi:MAG: hypothetical protein ACKPBV_03245 [Sphaerospermopsis kisseleviana]
MNEINSPFAEQAQTLWKITNFPTNTEITWRSVNSYDAVLVLSKALEQNPTRKGIQQVLSSSNFSVAGATGVVRFVGSEPNNGKITMVKLQPNCHSSGFVFIPTGIKQRHSCSL